MIVGSFAMILTQGCNTTVLNLIVKLSHVFCTLDGTSGHVSCIIWTCMNLEVLGAIMLMKIY